MDSQPRGAPITQMDALRALLASYADGDLSFQTRLIHLVQPLKKTALPELGDRLTRPGVLRGLRKMILSIVAKFDWPEWIPYILQALSQEQDLGVFDEGCAVLGSLGTPQAIAALRRLQELRTDSDRRMILHRELGQLQPQQSVEYYLSRLMEGQSNPRLAHQGARLLAVMATAVDLPALMEAHQQGDPLTRKLALRLIASIPDPVSATYLKQVMEETLQIVVAEQRILGMLPRILTLQRASAKQDFFNQVVDRMGALAPDVLAGIEMTLGKEGMDASPFLDSLQQIAGDPVDQFLVKGLTLLVEGKIARYSAFLSETQDTLQQSLTESTALIDQSADSLLQKLDAREITLEETKDVLSKAFRSKAGSDVLVHAFLRIISPDDRDILDELHQDPDLNRRIKYLDILGAREEDAFVPFFLKAMNDPIAEVGFKAIHHLGKLPSSFPRLLEMFHSGHRDQLRLAIRVFGENRTRLAAEPLLELIQVDQQDEILVEAVEAVGSIGYPSAAPVLLDLLHDGKPLNLQSALCRALGDMARPEASLGLLQKAPHLKHPKVLILCLEGALRGYPGFQVPFPTGHLPDLLQLVERCCDDREGEGQRFRAIMAMQDLYTFDQKAYERLKDRFSDFLFEMRTKEAWDRESNDKVAATLKELGLRGASLGLLAQKEAHIQNMIHKVPPAGPARIEALLAWRESLSDPGLILRPEFSRTVSESTVTELARSVEWKEIAHLCEIGGKLGRSELVEPIKDIYSRAMGLGLKSAAREALIHLGLTEADMVRRSPVHSILVLEPSAFFRKRLVSALSGREWEVRECSDRSAAEALLDGHPVDLLFSETQDPSGELLAWIESQWVRRRCRYVMLSASSRDLGPLQDQPWVIGTLFKPYPLELVVPAVQG